MVLPSISIHILIILSIFFILVTAGFASNCESSWPIEIDNNNLYNNYITYTRVLDGIGSLCIKQNINQDGNFRLVWKRFPDNDFSGLSIKKDGMYIDVVSRQLSNKWRECVITNVKKDDTITFDFWFTSIGQNQVWISFPSRSTNTAPERPEILSSQIKRYNDTSYNFSVKSDDLDNDRLNLTFWWGDGSKSQIGPFESGRITYMTHSWAKAGTYKINITATDEHGSNSSIYSEELEVSWLVKVRPGALLQPIIDSVHPNTTLLLEGKDYIGPINIDGINYINITSNVTQSNITSNVDICPYTIGVGNAKNITINKLDIIDGLNGIYLQNCSFCDIKNNIIFFTKRGIHLFEGQQNIIERNYLKKVSANNYFDAETSEGISIEGSRNNIVDCNYLQYLDNPNSFVYHFRNSTFKKFCVAYDNQGMINLDDCCGTFSRGVLSMNCQRCKYVHNKIDEGYCSLRLPWGVCIWNTQKI